MTDKPRIVLPEDYTEIDLKKNGPFEVGPDTIIDGTAVTQIDSEAIKSLMREDFKPKLITSPRLKRVLDITGFGVAFTISAP